MKSRSEDRTPTQNRQGARHESGHKPLVVVVTGPSSAGKSSLVRKLCELVEGAKAASLDRQLELWLPGHVCRTLEEACRHGFSASLYHELLRTLSRTHPLLFCDHVLCGHRPWELDLREKLADAELFVVELFCESPVLEERERMRPDRKADIRHALSQARRQADAPCEWSLRLDSGIQSTDELAVHILEALHTTFPTTFPRTFPTGCPTACPTARPTACPTDVRTTVPDAFLAPIPESPGACEVLA